MTLPTISLDTRDWTDLVDDARARIPRIAPSWTDHNYHDPGITLIELMAWLVEADLYRLDQIGERLRRKFLALTDARARGAAPASGAVAFARVAPAAGAVQVPAGLVLAGPGGAGPLLRVDAPMWVTGVAVAAVQSADRGGYRDRTALWRAGMSFDALGGDPANPHEAPALLVGLRLPGGLAPASPVAMWLAGPGDRRGAAERARVERELPPARVAAHHGARTVWEWFDGHEWRSFVAGMVDDATRALTLDGPVTLALPAALGHRRLGAISEPLAWLRCRLAEGRHDAPPRLARVASDAVGLTGRARAHARLDVAAGAAFDGGLAAGGRRRVRLAFDPAGALSEVAVNPRSPLEVDVLGASPPTAAAAGWLDLDVRVVGRGDGGPWRELRLPDRIIEPESLRVVTSEGGAMHGWSVRDDHDASDRGDRHVALSVERGVIRFGDDERGRALPDGAVVIARYERVSGAAGNVPADRLLEPSAADRAVNRVVLGGDPRAVLRGVAARTLGPTAEGRDADDIDLAEGRLLRELGAHERLAELLEAAQAPSLDELEPAAVRATLPPARAATLADLERLALDAPGTEVARARAWGRVNPRHPGLVAPGCVTVVVVPWLPDARPEPTPGLVAAVRRHLEPRRLVGTRLFVVGPTYCEVRVSARVVACAGAATAAVRNAVEERLAELLHPLRGGQDGRGWRFGRDVPRTEVLAVIDGTEGVNVVTSLALWSADSGEVCDNVCVPALGLVVGGEHAIEVEAP